MTDRERAFLFGELSKHKASEAAERVCSAAGQAIGYWSDRNTTPNQLIAAKCAAVDLALIAEGGLVLLGQVPVFESKFGAFTRPGYR
jgi:hypothetical protein